LPTCGGKAIQKIIAQPTFFSCSLLFILSAPLLFPPTLQTTAYRQLMVALHGLALLAILAGSSQRHGYPALAQAYQDAAHYYLPSNIYDNLPPGIETPAGGVPQPSQASSPAQLRSSQRSADKLLPGPDDTPRIDVTTPLFNAVYTPSSDLIMTWTHNGIEFPNNWTPQQSLLDMITNFSHSPLLTKDDMTNLAKMKLEDLKRSQLASIMKDSPIWLHCLRLVSEPSDVAGKGQVPIQPNILFDPGYDLQKVSRMVTVGGGAGGQLTWTIPVDWPYEGEFEIRIPSLPCSNQTVAGKDVGTKSYTFWILRDDATRKANPEYTPSSANDIQSAEKDANRHRALSIFLGVSAMILALILLRLGFMIGIYRRRWTPSATSLATAGDSSSPSPTSSISTKADSQDFAKGRSHPLPPSLLTQGIHPWVRDGYPQQKRETGLLERVPGDEDAHSASTLSSASRVPEDDTFVDRPLYDDQDCPPKVDSKKP